MKITEKIVDELSHRINETHTALTRREFVLFDQVRSEERYVWKMHSGKSSWKYSRLVFAVTEKKRADRKRDFKKIERKTENFLRVFQTSIAEVGEDFRMFRKNDMAIIQTWTRVRRGMGRYGMGWEFLAFSQLGWELNGSSPDTISFEWEISRYHPIRMGENTDTIPFFRELPKCNLWDSNRGS